MKIEIEGGKTITKKFSGRGSLLLKELNLNASTVLMVRNGTLVPEDEFLKDTDEIKILSVVSGG